MILLICSKRDQITLARFSLLKRFRNSLKILDHCLPSHINLKATSTVHLNNLQLKDSLFKLLLLLNTLLSIL